MRRTLTAAALAALTLAACQDASSPTVAAGPEALASEAPVFIVTFKDGVDVDAATADLARQTGMNVMARRHFAARGFTAAVPLEQLRRLSADPRVELIERDHIVTLDLPREMAKPGSGGGGAQSTPWGITRVGGAGDGTGKTAWIIDSGIDMNHADLNTSKACHIHFAGNSPSDGNGHGTHVAGTVAAKNNGQDVVGVAANAYVCSVRVLGNSGSGSYSGIIAGVNYVAANAGSGDVANMSLGGTGTNATLEAAVADVASLGVKMVLAAGNSGVHANGFTPARVNGNNIYTISATASNDCMASWSNYGNPPVDYAAPGVSILSTKKGGGTTTMSGTSMAAPHVAGILLLGGVRASGNASCDPDGNPDPIASR
jgi:subtilisin family serine protease